jgi:membrane-associated phospholipid phosphatase
MQWSAFPSDTAALFFFLATCLWSISTLLGSLALLDAAFLICLPRVFLGIHYPTDILAGAVIGVVGGYWATRPNARAWLQGLGSGGCRRIRHPSMRRPSCWPSWPPGSSGPFNGLL